mmetsp:Transcript_45201/g.141657  ORF Transcript_45201/g.141657 Transcript_45201/m.141657 type:complete len:498 (-) Transcript_45201:742-2235(-)|eukprot:CAMPEP_0118853046 /NCGR_PEP_ID=MMETSP1163-20130328/1787_1 /TAXON_ID=124430 /ORGANISM="Phaeomonas parva, Strain CCMP2877" /LENGTH=497 /DNA_ID=CAMNT_0006785535 /DNA_START=300 /DNA_END=1793 /DNA_ORIENTATION=-
MAQSGTGGGVALPALGIGTLVQGAIDSGTATPKSGAVTPKGRRSRTGSGTSASGSSRRSSERRSRTRSTASAGSGDNSRRVSIHTEDISRIIAAEITKDLIADKNKQEEAAAAREEKKRLKAEKKRRKSLGLPPLPNAADTDKETPELKLVRELAESILGLQEDMQGVAGGRRKSEAGVSLPNVGGSTGATPARGSLRGSRGSLRGSGGPSNGPSRRNSVSSEASGRRRRRSSIHARANVQNSIESRRRSLSTDVPQALDDVEAPQRRRSVRRSLRNSFGNMMSFVKDAVGIGEDAQERHGSKAEPKLTEAQRVALKHEEERKRVEAAKVLQRLCRSHKSWELREKWKIIISLERNAKRERDKKKARLDFKRNNKKVREKKRNRQTSEMMAQKAGWSKKDAKNARKSWNDGDTGMMVALAVRYGVPDLDDEDGDADEWGPWYERWPTKKKRDVRLRVQRLKQSGKLYDKDMMEHVDPTDVDSIFGEDWGMAKNALTN